MLTRLPPLNAIRAFHAASRHLNFSRAAEELGVTQGAISKQIIALEDYVGIRLFERHSSGLSLTNEGKSLKEVILPAFGLLESAFSRFERRPPRANSCRISTIASFASKFLVPRLDAFHAAFPNTELEILASDRLIDLEREEIDISIRYGLGDWNDLVSTQLTSSALLPVCQPGLIANNRAITDRSQLSQHRLIQVFSNNEWTHWARAAAIELPQEASVFIMEDFIVAMSAALTGQGLAILPEILVRDHLAKGELVQFSDIHVDWDRAYYIAHTPPAQRRANVPEIIEWLKTEAQTSAPDMAR